MLISHSLHRLRNQRLLLILQVCQFCLFLIEGLLKRSERGTRHPWLCLHRGPGMSEQGISKQSPASCSCSHLPRKGGSKSTPEQLQHLLSSTRQHIRSQGQIYGGCLRSTFTAVFQVWRAQAGVVGLAEGVLAGTCWELYSP